MEKRWKKIAASVLMAMLILPMFSLIGITEVFAESPGIPDYTGTREKPHPITNKYELASIGSDVFSKAYPLDGYYIQTQDIVFTEADFAEGGDFYNEGKGWKPIGYSTLNHQFKGTYNGGGFVIENIYINRPDENNVGIFGYVASPGEIKNLANQNGNITGSGYVGGIIGNDGYKISNCYNTGSVTAVNGNASGVCGGSIHQGGSIINCYNTGKINAKSNAAGIANALTNSGNQIENCYNTGNITSETQQASGIIGQLGKTTSIKECYNTGKISGVHAAGITYSNQAVLKECINTGEVIGKENAGGIVVQAGNYVEECFNTGAVNGGIYGGGIAGTAGTSSSVIIKNSYNLGKISGNDAAGISNKISTISNCYNAGQVTGTSFAGGLGNNGSSGGPVIQNSYFDSDATQLDVAYPGNRVGRLTTAQMTGMNAFTSMVGLNSDVKYAMNQQGYPELYTFRQSTNAALRELSAQSVKQGNGDNGNNPDNPDGGGNADGNGQIIGTVQPAQLKAVVPTVITFEIDPSKTLDYAGADGDDSFISPSFAFRNESNSPLQFSIESITAKTDMPGVVNQDTYTDEQWQNLNRGDTNSNISFGFLMNDTGEWVNASTPDGWYGNSPLNFGTIGGNSSANLHLKGKYGLNWGNALAKQITYDVVYKVELAG